MKYLLGMDIGTSAVKGALTTEKGEVVKVTSKGFDYMEKPGFKALAPEVFTEACFGVIKELAAEAGGEVAAICSCCASGNPVFLDADLVPLTPFIGWQTEVPTEDLDAVYTKEEQKAFYRRVGWNFFNGMPAADLAWLKVHRPDILEKTRMMAMNAEYLNFRITGKWGISRSMGTPSYLIDQEKAAYHLPTLAKFGLTPDMLPPVYEKGTVLGGITPDAAKELGIKDGAKVVLGTFDHPSGALGAGVFDEGDLLLSCGTSWVELFPVSTREKALSTGGLTDVFNVAGEPWCVMKSIPSISDKIDRLREHYFGKVPHKVFDGCAAQGAPGCRGLEFDFTDADLERGKGYDKPEIARAVIESAARLLKNNLEALEKSGLRAERITAIGGITNSPVCTGIISQILGREIRVVNGQSAGAVGSCLLAGIGAGYFTDEKDAFEKMYAVSVRK